MNTQSKSTYLKALITFTVSLVLLSSVGLWLWHGNGTANNSSSTALSNGQFHPAGPLEIAVSLSPTTPRVGENSITIQVRTREQHDG